MHRSLATVAAATICVVSFTGCAKAKELIDKAGKGLQSTASAVPKPDNVSDADIKNLSKVASAVKSALKVLPDSVVPATAQAEVEKAATTIDKAVQQLASDPAAAKVTAAKAITALNTAIADTEQQLGC
jgi:hypothetical protein